MVIKPGCFTCENTARFDELPPRERIAADEHWRAAHAVGTGLPGWLVLVPHRHVLTIADLTDVEAAGLGYWQVRLSRALQAVTGCAKTYVVQFAEAEGFGHVHFHVIPRPADLPADRRGPNVFGFLGQPDGQAISAGQMDAVAVALTEWLQQRGEGLM
ncbi:HIT family protein [Micromonospora yasonensis]|uniref:HIT family protein n=1 Tax=Micromonospora yasonensis TaxID=1128667 RepID=UPI002231423E|nr:HIT family protein [Micromonospora yasonensis]MCW3839472.1 HIT family protein [Micromonospora yasonensis]